MSEEELGLVERMAQGLTTDEDAQRVRQMMRDLEELLAGVHLLATNALEALGRGEWQNVRRDLERLEVIG